MAEETCGGCRFYNNYMEDGTVLDRSDCRRYPPRNIYWKNRDSVGTDWPEVTSAMWCGEFSATSPHPIKES